jgi:hypothetical protein
MSTDNDSKIEKLFNEYADFVSSDEESEAYLKENGYDPDQLVNEGIRKAKLIQLQLASKKTEREFAQLKASFFQKAKDQVDKLMNNASFNLGEFLRQEKLNVAFKNFEELTPSETREFLERHFLLKLEQESKDKPKE